MESRRFDVRRLIPCRSALAFAASITLSTAALRCDFFQPTLRTHRLTCCDIATTASWPFRPAPFAEASRRTSESLLSVVVLLSCDLLHGRYVNWAHKQLQEPIVNASVEWQGRRDPRPQRCERCCHRRECLLLICLCGEKKSSG